MQLRHLNRTLRTRRPYGRGRNANRSRKLLRRSVPDTRVVTRSIVYIIDATRYLRIIGEQMDDETTSKRATTGGGSDVGSDERYVDYVVIIIDRY